MQHIMSQTNPKRNKEISSDPDQQEKKRLQNRLAQQAFRRRQAESLRQLRNAANQAPESERLASLQRENARLRAQLVDVQGKLNSLLATMQTLSNTVTHALDDDDEGVNDAEGTTEIEEQMESRWQIVPIPPAQTSKRKKTTSPLGSLQLPKDAFLNNSSSSSNNNNMNNQVKNSLTSQSDQLGPHSMATTPMSMFDKNPLDQQIPDIWSFEYQMGTQRYLDAISASVPMRNDIAWQSNSPFSDHINILQSLLRIKLSKPNLLSQTTSDTFSLYQPVLTVLAMFNSLTRPDVMAWYAKTRFYHIVELTAWELRPCPATFERIHQVYRPTPMQLEHQNQYPRVINWIPFPPIRNRLIQLHAANPNIDQVFCDAVSGYVVEALWSDLVVGPPIKVYVRVTDLINSMNAPISQGETEGEGGQDQQSGGRAKTLPAPDVTSLFACQTYAKAAFYFLNMDKGASFYKVDPAFYGKYPELWDPESNIIAQGIPLKPDVQAVLTYPQPLNPSIVETYRSFIDFSIDGFDRLTLL